MAFVVDALDWRLDDLDPGAAVAEIERFLARVFVAIEREESIWVGDDFQTRPMLGEFDLWTLFSNSSPLNLPAELCQEMAAWLGRAPCYLDEEQWPDGFPECEIRVGDERPVHNPDVAWAHHCTRTGRPIACLGLRREGICETESVHGVVLVRWVKHEADHRAFWRDILSSKPYDAQLLQDLARHAFPDLYFYDRVWRGLGKLAGGYGAASHELRRYLSVLDEYGSWAFTTPPPVLAPGERGATRSTGLPNNQIIERRFVGLNLTMAPENFDVRKDRACREAREIEINGRNLYCEWHGKLEPHRNRIHVHPPVRESGGKVVIGILHEHLPLPG